MFLFEYIKNPKLVGAVAPSGKRLAEKMINSIGFKNAKYATCLCNKVSRRKI